MEKVRERYHRTNEVLGRGSFKTVYRAFDRTEGIEVAWNQVDLKQLGDCDIRQLKSEVRLLRDLKHKNIIRCYEAWVDERQNTLNFITELCTSGTLREYRERYGYVNMKVIKSWARQILEGLVYLHGLQPPIAHRDIKCDNIFINGNTGEIKIGDLGLACVMRAAKPKRAVLGIPEYMAPEILDRNYSEPVVDVYSFGMCVLEMVTSVEYPYKESGGNVSETFGAINGGKKPQALKKVPDPVLRNLIEKCLEPPQPAGRRPSASELLGHPFFQKSECPDLLKDQHAAKNPVEGKLDVGVEGKSAAPMKVKKSPPPEPRRCPVGFMGNEASYVPAASPSRADNFGMFGHARPPEGFEWQVMERNIEHSGRFTRERRVTMYTIYDN